MKKIFVLLLVFALTSPAIHPPCHCCGRTNDLDSPQASIQQKTPDCCQPRNVLTNECQNINLTKSAISNNPTMLLLESSPAAHFSDSALTTSLLLLGHAGSPPHFPTPSLYLLHNILRI